ncbi:MAG: 1-acyl-sn-glycerol-3-phosphate acyltransferase [Acidobacteria bacterium]|nr:1-acyl-sn-glycerol-3-phosphate acyltransferase [Acidobacteriota bacterium]MBV9476291.1 1-acyl-sn-glycerol-3-phosphate acyltransferase [Acidobacteriota bacterium]
MTLFRALARAGTSLFFDAIEIEGAPPADGPLLVVANHTNGLVDGLVITAAIQRRVSLTAKSTLKKNPLLAAIIWLADAVPLYRRQDAVDVAKNLDSFAAVRARLAGGGAVCIFPEGQSHSDASMREFKTGAARIALGCRGIGLKIVPVGLEYDAKQRFRSSVIVRFGDAIDADAFDDIHALTNELEARVGQLATQFRSVREMLWLRWTAELLATNAENPRPLDRESSTFAARAKRIAELRDAYERANRDDVVDLVAELRAYRRELRRLGIAPHEVWLSMHPLQALFFTIRELELLLAGGAIAAIGAVQHGLAFLADRVVTKKTSIDLDHWASNAIFYGFALFPLVTILGIAIVAALAGWRWALLYALAAPFTLVYSIRWSERIARAARRARTFFTFLVHRGLQRELQRRGRALIDAISRA